MSSSSQEKAHKTGEAPDHVSGQSNKPLSAPPHTLPGDDFLNELKANITTGLSSDEAKARLEEYGPNELDDGPGVQPLKILIRQIANAMILVNLSILPRFKHRFSDPIAGIDYGHGGQLWHRIVY